MSNRTISRGLREKGQATLETTGMLALAALLVLALVASMTTGAPALASAAKAAICKVVTLGQGSCQATPPDAQAHKPPDPCVVKSDSTEAKVSVSFVVTGKDGKKYQVDQMSDGTYKVTDADTGGVSVGAGVGFDVSGKWDNDKYGASASAGAHVGVNFTGGNVYTAKNQGDLKNLMGALLQDGVEDTMVGHGPIRWLTDKSLSAVGQKKDLPDPTSVYVEGGVEAGAEANVTSVYDGAAADVSVAEGLGYQKNQDGSTVTYYQGEVSGSAQAQMLGDDGDGPKQSKASAKGKAKVLTQVYRDKSGKVTKVVAKTITSGQADATTDGYSEHKPDKAGYRETTITLPIKNGQDATTANNFLLSQGLALGGSMIYPPAAAAGVATAVPTTLAFANAARDHGYVTQQDYDDDTHAYGANFNAKLLAKVGGSVEYNTDSKSATGAKYWDGTKFVDWPGCGG